MATTTTATLRTKRTRLTQSEPQYSTTKANGHKVSQDVVGSKPFLEYIPATFGTGVHRKKVQRRSLTIWSLLASVAIAGFHPSLHGALGLSFTPKVRAAMLSLLFPGAGYIACANVSGAISFMITWAAMPLCLLVWFGAGGVIFPLLLWASSVGGAYASAAMDSVFTKADIVATAIWISSIVYFNRSSAQERARGNLKRAERNRYLPEELQRIEAQAQPADPDDERELTLDELRRVQLIFDMGLQGIDDFSNFTIIDQFQPAALRYQLYEMMYCLAMYHNVYAPNFHGYSTRMYRSFIEKSLTPRVLGFWRWESVWGKFSLDWDPVKEDNIMVTGWFLQALAFYTELSGDMRYTEPGSLQFQVDKSHVYDYDMHSVSEALVRQWEANPYTLFPCEPNWIYSPCNFMGWIGQTVYDRIFDTDHTKRLGPRFEQSLVEELGEADGSILPIRSELTGFTIPGICGALGDLSNALYCRGSFDHVARRMWAIFRREAVSIDKDTGELSLKNLKGADKIDPGSYSPSPHAIYAMVGNTAAEFGDEELRQKAIKKLENGYRSVVSKTGALRFSKEEASFTTNTSTIKAYLLRNGDWRRIITKGPSETTKNGPVLDSIPYPGVLVAKARSTDMEDLSLVLYPSGEPGNFDIGLKKLQPGQKYVTVGGGATFVADNDGNAQFKAHVEGRTVIHVKKQVKG
ncbi:hypothetical protein HBI56_079160 [Parastagonospora nodorum]|nr:hypothetical protein HBH53_056780 [Parastagonospora nodorum]KAH4077688.1 hypothetical protein HBH46_240000 [Parastagonospora nodorum]KAH4898235.1 hypothetical protein HBI80_186020 [Parastagonospora nodorum]KAH4985725.1 hypothetical protein HBI76_115580 [Parastagonospora nodorum]KAH5047851.1 hypothetical protein HBH96_222680 [Parastagonospora nodorum]